MPAAIASRRQLVQLVVLISLPFVVYSNGYHHAFQLDDRYTITSNASLRSLRFVPRYFVDPATYTSVREQADYRPVLQTSYALNYRLAGYDMPSWHLTQILLHIIVTLGLFLFTRRILELLADPAPDGIAFVAALVFAVHPTAAGVVDYLNARSSLLTAAFLLPALITYAAPIESRDYAKPQWRTAILYLLALFTKVEAVGALGALWAYELWQRAREDDQSLFQSFLGSFDRRTIRRLAPALAITIVYFVVRWYVMRPFPFDASRHAADVGAKEYFVTQLTAWWYYVARWIAPVRLVADYLAYPVYRSWLDPVVLLSLGGWIVVASLLVTWWRRAPYLLFLAIAALALLSPTSSIAPLAEMVNEHRPYLPMALLSLAFIIPAGRALRAWRGGTARRAVVGGLAVVTLAFALLAYNRNEVFATEQAYWTDVVGKAPSSRAHLNLGVALMSAGQIPAAKREIEQADQMAPTWYFPHINLAVIENSQRRFDAARAHLDSAVMYDQFSGHALLWRGEFFLSRGDYASARDDFLRSLPITLDQYRVSKGLAAAYQGLKDPAARDSYAQRMLAIDSAQANRDLPALGADVASPAQQDAEMTQGLRMLQSGDLAGAEAAFRQLLILNPTHYGAHYQLAVTLDRLGKRNEARRQWQEILAMAQRFNDQNTIMTAQKRLSETP